MSQGRHNLHEARAHVGVHFFLKKRVGTLHGRVYTTRVLGARAASGRLVLVLTGRLLAGEFALWLRAQRWLAALPLALGLLTDWGAYWLRSSALGVALSWGTYGFARWAGLLLAHLLWTTDAAYWTVAVNGALSARGLLALHLTTRTLTDRVADSWADRIVARPAASRVTLSLHGLGGSHTCKENNKGNSKELHDRLG